MSLQHRPEHDELRATLRGFLADRMAEPAVRSDVDTEPGYRAEVWRQFCAQLGVAAIAVPEQYGGGGFGQVELGIVLEETGAALATMPLLATAVLGAGLLLASGDDACCAELLPGVAEGETTLAVAVQGHGTAWAGPQEPVLATGTGTGWTLRGEVSFVLDGASADHLLVVGRHDAGASVFLVAGTDVERTPMTTLDETRKQAVVRFAGAPARLVGTPGDGDRALAHTLVRARAALAAESVGVCRRMLEMAVGYAKVREQFGRPIGSFQAVKHLCSTMLIETELATSATRMAADALDAAVPDAELQVAAAAAATADTLDLVAAEMIEVFGGIGFTWEHPAHLYYKRAVSSARLWGGSARLRAAIFEGAAR
ncbi:acyl-CoA dehydrogenase family protein [Amycolatopsis rhabdoformis]|uniref:Acyl-CoA dehydrogenase family protein n=1 Tax=Amycolatopsis rhabdoformis TaxID=1448059 RepID=A0ABZ1IDM3_9PSEU|nr:acyl-CoA dehydrogenase family protein [Amycolatopsis rhabdoformis]WSE32564.1 acyl-CoA dehydrogenase family protein [Amycolatopsis rhabdoformis]